MPKKAQMNANYRKNERLLEDGAIDVPTEESYTAGTGIAISEENVISNTLKGLPSSTSADEGKVLAVNSNGDAVWQTASPEGMTAHTYTSFTELKNDILNNPNALIKMINVGSTTINNITFSKSGSSVFLIEYIINISNNYLGFYRASFNLNIATTVASATIYNMDYDGSTWSASSNTTSIDIDQIVLYY